MSFSFGFIVPNEGETSSSSSSPVSKPLSLQVATAAPAGDVPEEGEFAYQAPFCEGQARRDHLVPFRWIENVQELLEKRRNEHIIYDDIELNEVRIEEASSKSMPAGGAQQSNNTNNQHLRLVDLSRSSFPKAAVNHNHKSEDEESSSLSLSPCNDLVPGVYEGGLKVWESSMDLVQYMHNDDKNDNAAGVLSMLPTERIPTDRPLRFLELGCGHGVPSCYLLRHVARLGLLQKTQFWLTDYNDFVIKDALVSNIVLNIMAEEGAESSRKMISSKDMVAKCLKLGSGDWFGLLDPGNQYSTEILHQMDWIAAAETLYTVEAAKETAILISRLLRPETGQAWVASKRYYFGVGGGVDAFRLAAESLKVRPSSDGGTKYALNVETVKVYDSGKANIRELLRVRLKKL